MHWWKRALAYVPCSGWLLQIWPAQSHSCLSADAKSWAHAVMLTFSPTFCKCISLECHSRLILAQCVRGHCQQKLWQLRTQFCLSNVVFLFLHIIAVVFHNSLPENVTFYKLDGIKMPPRFRLTFNYFFKKNPLLYLWSSYFLYCIPHLHEVFSLWASNFH